MDELVSFSVAILVENYGFNLPCEYAYDDDGNIDGALEYTGNDVFTTEDIQNAKENEYNSILAPTVKQLLDWLNIKIYQPNETGYWANSLENKAKYDTFDEALQRGIVQKFEDI